MSREEFDGIVSKILMENPNHPDISIRKESIYAGGYPDRMWLEAEEMHGAQFLVPYKQFIDDHPDGDFYLFSQLLLPDPNSIYKIESHANNAFFPDGFITVIANGCGAYYGFIVVDGKCSDELWFFDHEVQAVVRAEIPDFFTFVLEGGLLCEYPEYRELLPTE